jgi:DNA-directed RNA polymerase specialized sigma24 family protein
MNKDWILTQESFDSFLAWLHPHREQAGRKYEEIRLRLIKIFVCRGCLEPEQLADETINRVILRLNDIKATFIGDPSRYFFGVANKVHLESLRTKSAVSPPVEQEDAEQIEQEYQCLEQCLEKLSKENRDLVLRYYDDEKRAKIETRKRLADQLGIGINALRIRAHRIRVFLEQCVRNCMESEPA